MDFFTSCSLDILPFGPCYTSDEYILFRAKIGSFTPIMRGKSLLYVPFTNIFYTFSPLAMLVLLSLVPSTHFTLFDGH